MAVSPPGTTLVNVPQHPDLRLANADESDDESPEAEASGLRLVPHTFEEQIEQGPHSCRAASRLTSSPFPMLIFERQTGTILDANDAAVRASGWSRESLLGSTVSDLFPPKGPDGPSFVRLRHWDTLWTGPWIMRRRDGSTFFAEVGMIEAGDDEDPAVMVLVITPQNADSKAPRRGLASGE